MITELITSLCLNSTIQEGCNKTLTAFGTQTHLSQSIEQKSQEILKITTKKAYNVFGQKPIEYGIIMSSIAATKTIKMQTPFKLLMHEIEVNGQDNLKINANWKWELK